jgi:hypothetical protein
MYCICAYCKIELCKTRRKGVILLGDFGTKSNSNGKEPTRQLKEVMSTYGTYESSKEAWLRSRRFLVGIMDGHSIYENQIGTFSEG